nr:MAG TPA: hypothetical protein [Caudoviricetes sp.]
MLWLPRLLYVQYSFLAHILQVCCPRFAGFARFLNPNEYGLYISLSPFVKIPIDILGYINYNVFMGYIK